MELKIDTYLEIIKDAGACLMEYQEKGFEVEKKGSAGPVTDADLAANDILKKLSAELPGSWYISEESHFDPARLDSQYTWIIDPMDGTREFVERIPEFAVSVALVRSQSIIFSAVYNPNDCLIYQVEKELHSIEDNQDLMRSTNDQICISRSELDKGLFENFSTLNLRPVGSIAYKLALVAIGRFEGVISLRPKNEWDIAGGVGLIQASKKIACDILGRKFQWNRMHKLEGVLAGSENFVKGALTDFNLYEAFKA